VEAVEEVPPQQPIREVAIVPGEGRDVRHPCAVSSNLASVALIVVDALATQRGSGAL